MTALSNIQIFDDRGEFVRKLHPGEDAWLVLSDALGVGTSGARSWGDVAVVEGSLPAILSLVTERVHAALSGMERVQLPNPELVRRVVEGNEVLLHLRLESHRRVDGLHALKSALEDAVARGSGLRILFVPELDPIEYRLAWLLKEHRTLGRADLKDAITAEYTRLGALSQWLQGEGARQVARLDDPDVLANAVGVLEKWGLLVPSEAASSIVATDKLCRIRL